MIREFYAPAEPEDIRVVELGLRANKEKINPEETAKFWSFIQRRYAHFRDAGTPCMMIAEVQKHLWVWVADDSEKGYQQAESVGASAAWAMLLVPFQ